MPLLDLELKEQNARLLTCA